MDIATGAAVELLNTKLTEITNLQTIILGVIWGIACILLFVLAIKEG